MSAFDSTFNDAFFDTDVFSVSADYTPSGGDAAAILVNFFNEGGQVELSGGVTVIEKPIAMVKASDVTAPKQNETLEINSVTYYIIKATPDNEGITILELSKNQV